LHTQLTTELGELVLKTLKRKHILKFLLV